MIKEALDEYAAAQQRAFEASRKVNRKATLGASEVGLCERRIFWTKHNPTPGAEGSIGASSRGNVMEAHFWYPALRAKFGDQLKAAGPDQQTLVRGRLSATPDGVLTGLKRDALRHLGVRDIRSSCILVECKSIDPRVTLREAKEENVFQVHTQLGLVRELTPYKPSYALISYTDASFWDEVTEFAVKFDPEIFAAAQARADRIFGLTDVSETRPEGWIAGGRECEYCPWAKPCGLERRQVPTGPDQDEIDPQFVAEITDLCREASEYKSQGDELTKQFKDLQDQIKTRLRDKKIRKIAGVVSWSAVKGRSSIDKEKLQEKLAEVGLDIADYEKHGDPSDRLQILL